MTIIAPGAAASAPEPPVLARRVTGAGSGFAVPGATGEMEPQPAQPAGYSSAVRHPSAILALQEEQSASAAKVLQADDRDARRHARDMLEALADLQKGLLAGDATAAALARLEVLASTVETACEPGLASLLAAIRLRARLELLRQERLGAVAAGTSQYRSARPT